MKPSWALWMTVGTLSLLSSQAEAWGPESDSNYLGTFAQYGSDFYLQTVTAAGHFGDFGDRSNQGFSLSENSEAANSKSSTPRSTQEMLDLGWFLGAGIYKTSAFDPVSNSQISDTAYAFKTGLNWELGQRAHLLLALTYETLPVENYNQGSADFGFTYIIPLASGNCAAGPEIEDMEQDYLEIEKSQECVEVGARDRYPNVELGVLGHYAQAVKSATTSGRQAGSTLSPNTIQAQNSIGPQLVFNLGKFVNLRFKSLFYSYSQNLPVFLSTTTIGAFRPKADMAVADLENSFSMLLQYPKKQISSALGVRVGAAADLKAELLYSSFDSTSTVLAGSLTDALSVGAILNLHLPARLELGGSLDETVGASGYRATTAGLSLGFRL